MSSCRARCRVDPRPPHQAILQDAPFVLHEGSEPGVWIVRTATVIPDNERWLHEGTAAADLQAAMAWSASHEPADADLTDTLTRLGHGQA